MHILAGIAADSTGFVAFDDRTSFCAPRAALQVVDVAGEPPFAEFAVFHALGPASPWTAPPNQTQLSGDLFGPPLIRPVVWQRQPPNPVQPNRLWRVANRARWH